MPFQVFHKIKYVVFVCLMLATTTVDDNNSSYPVTSFTCPSDTPQIKYDVFVSFRGADIRKGFLSHLIEAISRKKITAFVDSEIRKGDELSEALVGAIEGSLISLIIFSETYASSRWCLLELVKIVECRKKNGQIVLPIFYKVDPSDVRHQKGTYGDAFAKHERKYSLTTMQIWRSALNESANLSGFHSSTFGDEAELVKEIVKSVSMRLHHVHQVNLKGLVGIDERVAHVESMLQLEAADVRIIGIWGMGGIGKTTIAQEVYNKLRFEYEGRCFLANIREESGRHGMISLKNQLFSTLLGEDDLKIDTPNGLPRYVERRLHRMKVLIILDDVNDSEQLEILAGTRDWFGSGSRIIITTRDKQVLAKEFANIYEVEALNFDESLRLFNLNAFKQNHLEREYHELSKKVVDYTKGIPLVLKVWGHLLHGKDKEIWESQLERLKKVQSKKIHDIIKLSYNDLDQDEKKIFLDIACFFDGLKVQNIKFLLKDYYYSVAAELERLKDKALISISQKNIVSMHDIIQETAWQIARQESIEDPRSQSRLFDPDDIYQVLKYNKGNEAIRSLVIDLSRIKQLHLNQVFAKMSNLHFLNIYNCGKGSRSTFLQDQGNLNLSQGLESLPNELRYLYWPHYPWESLPSKFSAENLIELNLPCSQVKKLWQEVPDLVNLKVLILRSSTHLKELPDFSKATNLKEIDLQSCVGLTSVHPSVFSLKKLEKLDLGCCISLGSLQSNIHLDSLRYLSLKGCRALKHFSVTSKNMIKLNLKGSGIEQLPSSIGLQSRLEKLYLAHTCVENLPASIKHLKRLRHLDLRHCRKLRTLQELPPSLETLDARGCISLKTVMFPSAIEQLKENKRRVAFWNCFKLDEHSLRAIELNAQINMMKFALQHLSMFGNAQSTYVYPGSKVPEWLEYKTTRDYMTIDLSFIFAPHSSHFGFIFCFIVPEVPYAGSVLNFNISTVAEGEDEGINVNLDRAFHGIESDHVYLMFDQACSRYLNSHAKHHPRLKIKVTVASRTLASEYVPLQLRGFGVSTINTTQYLSFVQKVELGYNIPNEVIPRWGSFKIPYCTRKK